MNRNTGRASVVAAAPVTTPTARGGAVVAVAVPDPPLRHPACRGARQHPAHCKSAHYQPVSYPEEIS